MARLSLALPALALAMVLHGAQYEAFAAESRIAPHAVAAANNAIVGTWFIKDEKAPFPFHIYVFNADGTMQQTNPDAGDPRTSDSDGKGIWAAKGDHIVGKWVELTADRATHKFAGSLEIAFEAKVEGDRLKGTRSALPLDTDWKPQGSPRQGSFTGRRVTLP
ncbi:MAG TPA: hypothetical protein VN723_00790 [Rhizomicrobium sp.]|jgi:hypothetical protein|nr:hypothetical protein [Rhizomicrobium sp.]